MRELLIQAFDKGISDVGKVHITVECNGTNYNGFSANSDIIAASAEAFLDAINKA